MSDNISNPHEQSRIWGDILPGTVFWQDTIAPENQALLDSQEFARELDKSSLKRLKLSISKAEKLLQVWGVNSYDKRLRYYKHMALQNRRLLLYLTREFISIMKNNFNYWQHIQAVFKAMITAYMEDINQVSLAYHDLLNNPPRAPKFSLLERVLATLYKRYRLPVIRTEKQAQIIRIKLDRMKKRLKEHETAVKNNILYEQLSKEMLLEVVYFSQQIVGRWAALGEKDEYWRKGERIVNRVQIEEAHYTPDEIQYKIKVSSRNLLGAVRHHLPDNVRAWNLVKPETLSELAAACERPVGSPHSDNTPDSFENGAWVVVYREGLTDGLFDFVDYERVITKYDHEKQAKYPIPLGVKRGRVVKWLYLSEHPHLMINGIPGSGKTNGIRGILTTLCSYHTPEQIRFFIVDLKRGGDFREYSETPHLAAPIITKISELIEIAPKLVYLMQSRMDAMYRISARDIDDYNAQVSKENRIPRVVIVIDECNSIDNLAVNKQERQIIWRSLTLIATQARAAGIHLLLGTQQSFSDSIPKSVRDNITFVLSGRQRTLAGSLATFGKGVAKKLPNIRGRMWCDDGNNLYQLQTPYVSKETVLEAIQTAQGWGKREPLVLPNNDDIETALEPDLFTYLDVARIAIEQFGGVMSQHKIHALDEIPKNISRRVIANMISEIVEREVIEYEGKLYRIEGYGSGYKLAQNTKIP